MSKKEKLLKKFLENPTSCSYFDIEKIPISLGFTCAGGKGSHIRFKHEKTDRDLTFSVHHNDCKDGYKTTARKIITRLIL